MEAGKTPSNRAGLGEPGNRVFKLKISKSVRGKLKELYDMLTSLLPRDDFRKAHYATGRSGRTASFRLSTTASLPASG
jgi:hypothetical protein